MNTFDLAEVRKNREKSSATWRESLQLFAPFLEGETRNFLIIIPAILANVGSSVLTPYLISRAIDGPILEGNISGLLLTVGGLVILYIVESTGSYFQARVMGHLSQRVLFRLRQRLFTHLQTLPIAFFNQNKTGDLISRLNNDTDKINQFLSEGILRFISIFFSMVGVGGMMLWLEWRMALVVFGMTGLVIGISSLLNRWIQHLNTIALEEQGTFSAEVQETLNNYRVLVAFQKQQFFVNTVTQMSRGLRISKTKAEIANSMLAPLYTFGSNIAQGMVLVAGVWLISQNQLTIGVLIGFIAYTQRFFNPLRILGSIVGKMQAAIAGWGRVNDVLSLKNDLTILDHNPEEDTQNSTIALSFEDVSFKYTDSEMIVSDVNIALHTGKTYALVGPTGGGKSTVASLMFRLYDPTKGKISFFGQDIRTVTPQERSAKIGFILQEPFLFSGSVGDNLLYGNSHIESSDLHKVLQEKHLLDLLDSFPEGLETDLGGKIQVSLGQRQLISFIRAVLREPDILILDEATANIDTITEQKLEYALSKLPQTTTQVIIAHRLNTIESADEIFFVAGDTVTLAGSFAEVLKKWN